MTVSAVSAVAQTARVPAPVALATPRWTLDASHSHVGFAVRHLMISNVRGEFTKLEGSAGYDPERPEATTVDVSVDVASINTREEKRDAHLRSADFFDVENYPTMRFVSTSARERRGELELTGDLTIHGVTREVTLKVEDITPQSKDPWGNLRVGASAKTKIRRSDFGMVWNAALETGGVVVGDEITITLEVELVKQ
jgi:polyisoprenoid-binding protein YceI